MQTITEIQTALGELVAAMVEKGIKMPDAKFSIRPDSVNVYLAGADRAIHNGDTASEAIEKARAYIAALPDPEELGTREYLGKVADAIDCGAKHNLPDEYVAPLRGVTAAVSSNLLTKEAAE